MSQPQPPLDERGEAHEALNSAVASYGPRILENPQMLGNVVTDLLPDLPREQTLLIAAAEAGVATGLSQHVRNQNLDPGTAVQLVARMLADKKAIDPAASMWVTTEYARALGYAVPVSVAPSGLGHSLTQPPVSVPPQRLGPTLTQAPVSAPPSGPVSAPPYGDPSAPPYGGASPSAPPYGGGGYGTTGRPWPGPSGPTMPGPTMPGGPPTRHGSEKRRNRTIMTVAAAVAGVLVIYVIAAAAAHAFPFTTHTTPTSSPAPAHTTHRPTPLRTPTASPSPTLPAGVAPLTQLLPGDLGGTATQCEKLKPPYHWKMPGLVQALGCADPSLPGGIIEAFQTDNSADFLTSWQSFDNWWGFDPTTAQNTCPPAGSNGEGTYPFENGYFPSADNQVVQCEWVGQKGDKPAYAWAYPTENAFFLAVGAEGSSFAALDNWWKNNSLPTASPSPSAP
jgi:hypothetical protein